MVAVDDNGNGGQGQRRTTKAADDDGVQDQAADYEGKGGEQAANNNGSRPAAACQPGRERETKIKILSLCKKTFFSNTVLLEFLLLPKNQPSSF